MLGMMFLVVCYRESEVHGSMCNNGGYVRPRLYVEHRVGRFDYFASRFFEEVDPPWVVNLLSCPSVYDGALRVLVLVPLVELRSMDMPLVVAMDNSSRYRSVSEAELPCL